MTLLKQPIKAFYGLQNDRFRRNYDEMWQLIKYDYS